MTCLLYTSNVSDAIFAGFMFEQTEPVAEETLTPDFWTNGTVEIDLSAGDNLSGVRDITLPDGKMCIRDRRHAAHPPKIPCPMPMLL